jgi:ectoine hydroxylase-related dioxygenase (phytanoyl-CoA dioxygenase family)
MFLKLDKYWGWWRGLLPLIWLYNFKNRKYFLKNKSLYSKWGIKKSIYCTIESKDLKNIKPSLDELPWLDKPDALSSIKETEKKHFESWIKNGYIILPKLFNEEQIENINEEISRLKEDGTVYENYTQTKIHNAILKSSLLKEIAFNQEIIGFLRQIFKKDIVAFQSLNFNIGSQQKPHADAIHMTTFPHGYMAAAWIALEDIGEDQGPISIFPGSHKLPIITRENISSDNSNFLWNDTHLNEKYELQVEQLVKNNKLKKEIYSPKKGDVLIWHYNLIHGGEPIKDPLKTRKSMVIHYFAKDVIAYHEISRRPAIMK